MLSVSLPLDIRQAAVARRSSRQEPWQVHFAREIGPEDLGLLHNGIMQAPQDPKAPLASLREPHHMLARLLAEGKPVVEVSAITGYSTSRIRTLQGDPAFRELMAHYEEAVVFAEADVQAQIKHVALTAGAILQERLEVDPDSFSNKDLKELFQTGLDRIGHGPTTKHQHTITDPTHIIEALKQAQAQEGGRIIAKGAITAEFTEVTVEHEDAAPCSGTEEGGDAA